MWVQLLLVSLGPLLLFCVGGTVRTRLASLFAFGLAAWIALPAPAAAQSETQYVVTPRFWYTFISTGQRTPTGVSVEHTPVPLVGGTLAVVPAGMGGTTFSLTGFYGKGTGDYQEGDGLGTSFFIGESNLSRLDIEGVAQFPIGKAGAYWSLGLRYVKTDVEDRGTDQVPDPFSFIAHANYYLAEIGAGASTALNAAGTQRFFGGLTLVAGVRKEDKHDTCCNGTFDQRLSVSTNVVGLDTNFGYSAALNSNATFYARYRLFVLTELEHFASPDSFSIVHGPELNLSFKLN